MKLTKKEKIVILDILDGIRFDCFYNGKKYTQKTFTHEEFLKIEIQVIKKLQKDLQVTDQ